MYRTLEGELSLKKASVQTNRLIVLIEREEVITDVEGQ